MGNNTTTLVAVAGQGRNSGKTTLICQLLARFPRAAAIKWCHHLGRDGVVITDWRRIIMTEGKDTWRMARAGATKVVMVMGDNGDPWGNLRRAMRLAAACNPVFVEGSVAYRHGPADLRVFVEKEAATDAKATAELAARAHLKGTVAGLRVDSIASIIVALMNSQSRQVMGEVLSRTRFAAITRSNVLHVARFLGLPLGDIDSVCERVGIRIDVDD